MTIRHCNQYTDLVSCPSNLYFFEHPYYLEVPHYHLHFTIISKKCPYITLDIVFLSAVPTLGQFYRQCFIVSLWFPYVGCWLFLGIKCLLVSLVCPIPILLSLASYCLQLFWELSHSSMGGTM